MNRRKGEKKERKNGMGSRKEQHESHQALIKKIKSKGHFPSPFPSQKGNPSSHSERFTPAFQHKGYPSFFYFFLFSPLFPPSL